MTAKDIIQTIELTAPLSWQEPWDNSGLQIGLKEAQVTSVLLCTDITERVIEEALQKRCEMIVSHHPLLFHGLKTIQDNTHEERITRLAIKNDLVLYSSHTPMDVAPNGVSRKMADKLGIENCQVLVQTKSEEIGLGVVGELRQPQEINTFLQHIKQVFRSSMVRFTKPHKKQVQRIALCGGAGSEFLETAAKQGADMYISADFKYHDFQRADNRITAVDIGHFESEQFTKEIFKDLLKNAHPTLNVLLAETDHSGIYYA
ncbi:MAG: Nif3-like dinuclear metal center hexameric protein [Paludibacteraceae bacterium]|nr:Nif3-like dinuclear metal center hexameric protein [Paludibacteraceae bacterium]MBR1785543.1 Nif3-like dinuclear metal center hexameric protein [Paludibacteraceae bacterium]